MVDPNKILSSISDPTFLLANGLITPQELVDTMKYLTYQPVSTDWEALIQQNQFSDGSPMDATLAQIYDQMQANAYDPDAMRLWILRNAESIGIPIDAYNGDITNLGNDAIDSYMKKVEEFYKRFSAYYDVNSDPGSGGYIYDSTTGDWLKPLDDETARKNLRESGLGGLFALPEVWRIIPDAATQEEAMALTKRAEQLAATATAEEDKMWSDIDRAVKTTRANWKAYSDNNAPNVTNDIGSTTAPSSAEWMYPSELPKGVHPNSPAAKDWAKRNQAAMAKYAVDKGAPAPKPKIDPEKMAAVRRALYDPNGYFAKQAEYYTAKGAASLKQPAISKQKQEAAALNKQAADKALLAYQTGSSPVLNLIANALPTATAALGGGGGGGGTPAPRILSDQEIQTMASMIAGGMQ